MENIRIGNSVHVSWRLYNNNGSQYVLSGKVRRLWIISAALEKEISSYGIQGRNELVFSIPADDLIRYGTYKIRLTIRESESGTEDATYELTQVFQVVSKSYPNASGAVSGVVELPFTTVLNNVVVERIEGLSAYEIAVNNGYEGTEQEWVAEYNNALDAATTAAADASAAITAFNANEQARIEVENERVAAEQARVLAEAGRVSAESTRVSNESGRVAAEEARVSAEAGRVTAENGRVVAESSRVSAESSRVSAESSRVSAESARATRSASDHTRAENDHSLAVSDHSTASSDHTTAAGDHTTAVSDHTRAENDHTTAAADHTTAGGDHTTATGDHTQAVADHTQAASDHTASVSATADAIAAAAAATEAAESIEQSDWSENDSDDPAYIKGRTHWDESVVADTIKVTGTGVVDSSNNVDLLFSLDGTGLSWPSPFPLGGAALSIGGVDYLLDLSMGYISLTQGSGFPVELAEYEEEYSYGTRTISVPSTITIPDGIDASNVHKLDNKYLDLDSTPTLNSQKPVTSDGVKRAINAIPSQEQSDWNETVSSDPAYIKNKPDDLVHYEEVSPTDPINVPQYATEDEVSQLRSEVYKDLPYTKDKYYVNLSSATVGSTYQFAELSFSPFAYWVIPCKEGDQFKLTTSSNTATAKAYAILDKNNVVLAVQQTKVTDFDLVIPAGGATLIVNTATANPYMVRTQRYATKEELAETDERLSDEIANIAYTVDPILENPLRGVDFGTTAEAVKSAITKIWLQSANPANVPKVIANAPKLYIRYISNATGANRPTVLINDTLEGADTDAVISYALSSQSEPRAVKEIIRAKTLGGTNTAWGLGTDGANVYIEIDWSKISGTIRNLEIELNTANLQKMEVDRVALSDVSGPIIQGSLYGKNIVCFGDSLTELADLNSFRYSDYLAAFSGANIVNVGIGGAQLRQRLEPVTTPTSNSEAYAALDVVNMIQASIDQDFTKQAAAAEYLRDHASDDNTEVVTRLQGINWAKVDVVTIFAGTNDWYSGSNIGTTGTVGKSTTIGAINYIIQNLLGTYPHVKIFWFTPVVRWVSYTGGSGTAENFGDTYQAGSYTLKEFAALVETEVRLSHLPVCDLYNTLGWNMWNFSNYFPGNDGTHPRKPAGMRGIAARMFGFLLSHKNY